MENRSQSLDREVNREACCPGKGKRRSEGGRELMMKRQHQRSERTGFEGRAGDGGFCQGALVVVQLPEAGRPLRKCNDD
jgi:hypothetical protein